MGDSMTFIQRLNHMSRTWKHWTLAAALSAGVMHAESVGAAKPAQKVQIRRSKRAKGKTKRAKVLRKIEVSEKSSGQLLVELALSSPGNFNAYRSHDPERLVIDLLDAKPGSIPKRQDLSSWVSSGIVTYPVQISGIRATRVVVELRRGVRYELDAQKKRIRVSITPQEPAPGTKAQTVHNKVDEAKQAKLQAALKKAQAQIEAKQAQLKSLERSAGKMRNAQNASKAQIAAMDRALEVQRDSLAQTKSARKRLLSALGRAQRELVQTRARVRTMRAQEKSIEAKFVSADRSMRAREKRIQAKVAKADRYLSSAKKMRQESLELREKAQAQLDRAQKATRQAKKASASVGSKRELREKNKALREEGAKMRSLLSQEGKARRALELNLKQRSKREATLERRIAAANKKIAATDVEALKRSLRKARAEQQSLELAKSALSSEIERMSKEHRAAKRAAVDRESAKQRQVIERQRLLLLERRAQLLETQERLAQTKKARARTSRALAQGKGKASKFARQHRQAKHRLARAQTQLAAMREQADRRSESLRTVQEKLRVAQAKLDLSLRQLQAQSEKASRFEQVAKAQSKAAKPAKRSLISGLKLIDEGDSLRIVLSAQDKLKVDKRQLSSTMQLLEIKDARLAAKLERSFDASAYRGPIAKITSFNDNQRVSIMVNSAPDAPSKILRSGNTISWVFPRQSGPQSVQEAQVQEMEPAPVAMAAAQGSKRSAKRSRGAKWHGERIDIELQDAPIKDVLLLFSDIGRVNIIAGKGVSGQVSLKLNSVPWDQALDIILRSLGLGLMKEGNVIRVATLSDLEAERTQAIERANAQVQLKPLETRLIPLSYATVDEMVPKVQSVLSPRGTVTPDGRTNVLIVMDVAENISLAEQLVSQLDGQTPQVLIEARIVEARTQWLRHLGIQWGFDVIASPGTGNPTGLLFPSSVGVAGGSGGGQADRRGIILPGSQQNPNYAVDLPAPVGSGNGGAVGMSFGSLAGNLNTNLRLSAAEEGGEVRLISAPKVVTMDNTEASIEQGVQIPISQVSQNGVNTRYVNATLGLNVTPHVTNDGSIILEVKVQKNEADFINTGARGDPTILTKQANSRMLIQDGDTAVIGGIYTRNQSTNRKKVPWIADVPIIGWFFKNRSEADTRTELLIFLTPKIINRSSSIGG